MEPQRNGAEGVTVIVFVIVIVEKQCFSPYKITKKPSHNQWLINLFSTFSKIIYRAYRNSHLRNVALLQGGTFAVEIKRVTPLLSPWPGLVM